MPTPQVTQVWSVHFKTPGTPLYYVKDSDGVVHLAHLDEEGNVTKLLRSNCSEPTVIHGMAPHRPDVPKDYGEWIPRSEFKLAYNNG